MSELKTITIKDIIHTFSKYGYPLLDREEQGRIVEPESAIVASLHYSKEPRLILGIPVVLFGANGIVDYERLVALSLEAGKGSQMGYLLDVTQSLFSEFSYPIPEELKQAASVLQKNTLKSTQPFYDSGLPEVYFSYCLKKQDALQKKWNLILNVSYQTFRHKFQQYLNYERINEGNSQRSLRGN
ncbi:MAG: hypothetical protein ACE5PV_05215 [Candidatus Poribacteria bacterium]